VNGSTTASTVSYLSDYRPEVDDLRAQLAASQAEVTRLRAVVLDLSDAVDLTRQSADANARLLAVEAYQRGQHNGYERGARTYSADWRTVVVPIVESAVMRLTNADLEARRYGPGGREQFGRPMAGDRGSWSVDDLAALRQQWTEGTAAIVRTGELSEGGA
jgi:hypothetical protein